MRPKLLFELKVYYNTRNESKIMANEIGLLDDSMTWGEQTKICFMHHKYETNLDV